MRRRRESQISNSLTRQNNTFTRAFLYISLLSTAQLPVKMPNFMLFWRRKQAMIKFILFMNLHMVDRNSAPEEFACVWQSKRVGIITIETEKKMWIPFSVRRFRGCQPSWYLLKLPNIYARRDPCKREYLLQAPACIFGKASLIFVQTVFWNQMGIYIKLNVS